LLKELGQTNHFEAVLAARATPDDPNAVAVQSLDGVTLGFLSAAEAARYQYLVVELDRRGEIATCCAQLNGGTSDGERLWLLLDLAQPKVVASALGLRWRYRKTADKRLRAGGPPRPR
jgi:hypothetical protein